MAKCKNCKNLSRQKATGCEHFYIPWCETTTDSPDTERERDCKHFKLMTNADRIRSMTDDELVKLILSIHRHDIDEYEYEVVVEGKYLREWDDIYKWLREKVED